MELSLQKRDCEAKARASSQNLLGAPGQQFPFRGRSLSGTLETGGAVEVNAMDALPCTVLFVFEGHC